MRERCSAQSRGLHIASKFRGLGFIVWGPCQRELAGGTHRVPSPACTSRIVPPLVGLQRCTLAYSTPPVTGQIYLSWLLSNVASRTDRESHEQPPAPKKKRRLFSFMYHVLLHSSSKFTEKFSFRVLVLMRTFRTVLYRRGTSAGISAVSDLPYTVATKPLTSNRILLSLNSPGPSTICSYTAMTIIGISGASNA